MKIPKELLKKMDEDDKAELGDLTPNEEACYQEMETYFNKSLGRFKASQIIMGKVIAISKGLVTVDVGFKSEGMVSLSEFPESGKNLQIDDEVEVFMEKVEDNDGNVVLSKEKANKIKIWDDLVKTYEADEIIQGTVIAKAKGGVTVDIGLKAFLPGSQIDLHRYVVG